MVALSNYQDYRLFLRDFYLSRKRVDQKFTYASFSRLAGIRSPNYLKLVTTGEKNLTEENVVRFAKALDLSGREFDYFEALVFFNQAKNALQREYYQKRMKVARERLETDVGKVLQDYEFEMMGSWAHHALMVFTNVRNFVPWPKWIAAHFYDLISESEILQMMNQLFALGLLKNSKNGKIEQTFRRMNTEPRLQRLSAKIFYKKLLERAGASIDLSTSEEREFGTVIVGISPEQMGELRRRVRDFLKDLTDWAMENSEPRQVYSLSFFGFPLTSDSSSRRIK